MSKLVLYRKYRPQAFDEIIGQEHVTKTLINSIASGDISHAYLFSGPRGSGKTTIARIFAKAINCENPKNAEPCNKCSSCLEITQGRSIDLVEIDAASHRGIDDVRELKEGIKFPPVKSKYKIFIIDECHQLSKDAANALLKTLEEPPSHAIFLLATTEPHKMISTIISRCQRFDFKKLQASEITKKLETIAKKEEISLDKAAVALISLHSRGSFRDAESILSQCISYCGKSGKVTVEDIKELLGIVEASQIASFIDFILAKNTKEAISVVNGVIENGSDLPEFAKTLIFYVRQMLIVKINPEFLTIENSGLSQEELKKLSDQSATLSQKDIQKMLELFIDAENKMRNASLIQLPLEMAVVSLTVNE